MNLIRIEKEKLQSKIRTAITLKRPKDTARYEKNLKKEEAKYDILLNEYMKKFSQFSKDDGCGTHVYDRKLNPEN